MTPGLPMSFLQTIFADRLSGRAIVSSRMGAGMCNSSTVRDPSMVAFEVDGTSVLH